MAKVLLKVLIGALSTIVQIVVLPLNVVISATMPDLTDKISFVTTNIPDYFSGLGYALSWLPSTIVGILVFIISIEIAKYTIYLSVHGLIKVWNLFQKLKFW